jgi:hypothetical protein
MPDRHVYLFRVDRVEQRSRRIYVRGTGADAQFVDRPEGWWIVSGNIAFAVGHDRPDIAPGDVLELRKRDDGGEGSGHAK